MIKRFVWLSASVLAILLGQSTFADTPPATAATKSTKPCHCHQNKMIDKLGLSDEQQGRITAIREKSKVSDREYLVQLKKLRHEMNAMVASDKVDQSKLDSLIAKRTQIRATMLKNHMMVRHEIYALLTPQQKAEYQSTEKKWAKKHSH